MNQETVAVLLGSVAIIWYYYCLFQIGLGAEDLNDKNELRSFMSLSITSIGAALATFVGGLLGMRQLAGANQVNTVATSAPLSPAVGADISAMQWAATILYILSLLVALWLWKRNNGGTMDPAVTNLGKTLLGLMGGALAIVLNAPA
jgi:hypothetical protein